MLVADRVQGTPPDTTVLSIGKTKVRPSWVIQTLPGAGAEEKPKVPDTTGSN
jgi:hypothetical protein